MTTSGDAANPGACLGDPVPAPSAKHPLQDGVGTGDLKLRHALQITSAWLYLLTRTSRAREKERANIDLDGVIKSYSIGEVLDLANEALEPDSSSSTRPTDQGTHPAS